MALFIEIDSEEKLEEAFRAGLAVLFKHSTVCGMSAMARAEMVRFAGSNPSVPVYLLGVREHRDLSAKTEQFFGVRHESPQVIVIKAGRAAWNASHAAISAGAVEKEIKDEL
jgi:bacillithiol system protein YtxJ